MAAKKKANSAKRTKKPAAKSRSKKSAGHSSPNTDPLALLAEIAPDYVIEQLLTPATVRRAAKRSSAERDGLRRRANALNIQVHPDDAPVLDSINRINPKARVPVSALPVDVRQSLDALKPQVRRFHGSKFSLAQFPFRCSCRRARNGSAT